MFRKSSQGLTAIEAIIALALFGVVAVLLVSVFNTSIRISTRESVNLELEQSCYFLVRQIEQELTRSGTSGISYLHDPQWDGVAINPIEDITSEGTLVWGGKQVIYFRNQTEKLYKQTLLTSKTPLLSPKRFTPEEILSLVNQDSPTRSTIGKRVTEFQVVNRRPDGSSRLVNVSVELERDMPNDKPRRFRLDALVTILN